MKQGVISLLETDHRKKGERNEKLIADLEAANLDYKDWTAVAAFYAAIHYLMAYFHHNIRGYDDATSSPFVPDRQGLGRLTHHWHRHALVKKNLPRLLKDYNYLYQMSEQARYHRLDMSHLKTQDVEDMKGGVRKFRTLT